MKTAVSVVGLMGLATLVGAMLPVAWHNTYPALSKQERESHLVLKVFQEQWPDKPFEVSTPALATPNVVKAPSLLEGTPMMTEPLAQSEPPQAVIKAAKLQPKPERQPEPDPPVVRHDYCYPGHRVDYGRHWRCAYSDEHHRHRRHHR